MNDFYPEKALTGAFIFKVFKFLVDKNALTRS